MTTKTEFTDLAIFGREPAFAEKLHVGRPSVRNRQRLLDRINDILDRSWLTNNGPSVEEFERKLAHLLGVKHCLVICNGTLGLQIAIRALDLSGEVIVPSFTFVATAHALQWLGITPVFCDIDEETLTLDPERIEELITPRTSGIIGVHLFGRPCHVNRLESIARNRNIKLIFDAAHAFSCSYRGQMIGGFGDAEVFSFHATKFFNTSEGGAITTNNDDVAAKVRLMRNFGFAGYDNVVSIGTNGKMAEVIAAMGLTALEDLESALELNRRNYRQYQLELAGVPGTTLLEIDETERRNYQYVGILVNDKVGSISRNELMEILHAENVIARRYFYPGCHAMEPYRSTFPQFRTSLPVTERIAQKLLLLPTGGAVSDRDISLVCSIIRLSVENADSIRRMKSKQSKA